MLNQFIHTLIKTVPVLGRNPFEQMKRAMIQDQSSLRNREGVK